MMVCCASAALTWRCMLQLLDLAMKGFCTNSRGASVAASPEQLPSAAEIQKLESKLRTVVARAEQVLLHH